MDKTKELQSIGTKGKILISTLTVLIAIFPYYLDSLFADSFAHYIFWGLLGIWSLIFFKSVFKYLAFKLFQFKHKPHNKLSEFQKSHYKHRGNMHVAYPSYTEDGVFEYKKTPCYFYKKRKKSPCHYPCFLLKPVVDHQSLKDDYYLWNDMNVKLLKKEGPLTVGDWFLKNGYNYFDDVKKEFDDNFVKNKEMSVALVQILYLMCLGGFVALYIKTPLGPLTSSFIAFLGYYFMSIAMGVILGVNSSKKGEQSIIYHPFWSSVKDETNYFIYLNKGDFSGWVLAALSLNSCFFCSKEEEERIRNSQTIEEQPAIDILNPVNFVYNPNLESWKGRIKLSYNSKKGPFDQEREKLARRVEQYIGDKKLDFLNLSENESQQILEHFDSEM